MDVRMPDGTLMRNVPEGTPKDVIYAKYMKHKEQILRQEDFDSMPAYQQALIGAGQSVDELVTGVRGLFGGDTAQARADQQLVDSVDSGWKTAGKIAGDVGMASIPALGLSGMAARASLPLATRAAAGLGGEAWGAGVVEGLQNESLTEGAKAAATTAAVGGGLSAMMGRGGQAADELYEAGVSLTPGQRFGGAVKAVEDFLGLVPGAAGGVRAAKERALNSWNKMLRSGEPPQQAMKDIQQAFGSEYDNFFRGDFELGPSLRSNWGEVMQAASKSLPEDEANKVINLLGKLSNNVDGKTAGSAVQSMHRTLGELSSKAARNGDGTLADLYKRAQDDLIRSMPNPGVLKALNTDYAAYKVLEDATGKVSPAKRQLPGTITPNELMTSAAKGRRGATARGEALMQDEARRGAQVLGGDYPSGGIGGAMADISPVIQAGAIVANPALGGAALAARGAMMNRPMQSFLTNPATSGAMRGGAGMTAGTQTSELLDTLMSPEDRELYRQRLRAQLMRMAR